MTQETAFAKVRMFQGRLSGSRAYGTPRPDSDWDYWMSERNVKKLAKHLTACGVAWSSPFLGSLTFHVEGVQIEVSYLFPKNAREARLRA